MLQETRNHRFWKPNTGFLYFIFSLSLYLHMHISYNFTIFKNDRTIPKLISTLLDIKRYQFPVILGNPPNPWWSGQEDPSGCWPTRGWTHQWETQKFRMDLGKFQDTLSRNDSWWFHGEYFLKNFQPSNVFVRENWPVEWPFHQILDDTNPSQGSTDHRMIWFQVWPAFFVVKRS